MKKAKPQPHHSQKSRLLRSATSLRVTLWANFGRHSPGQTHFVTQPWPNTRMDAVLAHALQGAKWLLWLVPSHGFLEVQLLGDRIEPFISY